MAKDIKATKVWKMSMWVLICIPSGVSVVFSEKGIYRHTKLEHPVKGKLFCDVVNMLLLVCVWVSAVVDRLGWGLERICDDEF